jgi:Tat protein secretion system quality control protein TatD with DNase activity
VSVFEKICEIKGIENRQEFKEILKENFKKMFLN